MQELDRSSNALQWSPSQLDVSCVAKIDKKNSLDKILSVFNVFKVLLKNVMNKV